MLHLVFCVCVRAAVDPPTLVQLLEELKMVDDWFLFGIISWCACGSAAANQVITSTGRNRAVQSRYAAILAGKLCEHIMEGGNTCSRANETACPSCISEAEVLVANHKL